MFIHKKQHPSKKVNRPKDTLVIIGNGFDIWQGFKTGYDQFEDYYHAHLDEILKKLKIKKHTFIDKNGKTVTCSDVELFYGNPFSPTDLPHSFWSTFEASLDKMDDQLINQYFGKERAGLKGIKTGSVNAQRILRQAFCDWIATIDISEKDMGYRFGSNCLFINFNYTDTLLKRFHVRPANEYHIHGEAHDRESIIFGHASHPEYALREMHQFGGRLRGLYYIEDALYRADKHAEDNYVDLCMFLALHGVDARQIKNIYVLGHSFGDADVDYFKHLVYATQGMDEDPEDGLSEKERVYLDSMDAMAELNLNVQYAIHHRERALGMKPVSYPVLEKVDEIIHGGLEDPYYHMTLEEQLRLETAAVRRRFFGEQAERNWRKEKEFYKMLRRGRRRGIGSDKEIQADVEKTAGGNVKWHISYYSNDDKERITGVMDRLGCKSYELYPTIDECLVRFKR